MRYELFRVIDEGDVVSVKNSYSFDVGRMFISPAKIYGISGNDAIIRFNASI
jgi:hypothetical protein